MTNDTSAGAASQPSSSVLRPSSDSVAATVLAIVAEKTGYPPEMLDLDLDMEADLGVDTVKQAETFAAIRAAFDIPRQDDLKLRDYPTLASVIQFVYTNRPELAQPTTDDRRPTTDDHDQTVPPVGAPPMAAATPVVTPAVVGGQSSVVDPVAATVL